MSTVKIEELEGEGFPTSDYFFKSIGDPVPLKSNDYSFDPETLPSHPLALSERFRLTFVAHSSGKPNMLNTHAFIKLIQLPWSN